MENQTITEEKNDLNTGLKEGGGLVSEQARSLLDVGAYLGHHPSKTNPKMKFFTLGSKNNLEIINIDKTVDLLDRARKFIEEMGRKGKKVLFVGSNPIIKDILEEMANRAESPFVAGRWLGGLVTNFSMLSKRLKYFFDIKEKEEKGELKKYTKKEQGDFRKKIEKMTRLFYGLDLYKKLPDALVIVDIEFDSTALHEASLKNIPIIALINTNSDPDKVDHPIPASNHTRSSVEYILKELVNSFNKGKSEASLESPPIAKAKEGEGEKSK